VLLAVQVVQYGEVLDELLNIRREVVAASGACKYVRSPQIHQTVLTERVTARKDSRNFFLIIVVIKADRTSHLHLPHQLI